MRRIRPWQWLNILALDAALIALAWQATFAAALGNELSLATRMVLGLSVWLCYMADRLFDVAHRPMEHLLATRHRFAKQHSHVLWSVWAGILLLNIGTALRGLSREELGDGLILLTLCLLYTGLNQLLSKHFFPKEVCVALIYTGGVVVFLPHHPTIGPPALTLLLLCWINCLMIGTKERTVDAALQVRSLSQLPTRWTQILMLVCAGSLGWLSHEWALRLGLSLLTLYVLHRSQHALSTEVYRVLTDSALFVGPILSLWLTTNN
jgi:hypothetical protein